MPSARIISRGSLLLRSAKPSIPRVPASTFTRPSPSSIRSNLIILFNKTQTRFYSSSNDNSNKGTHIGQLKVEKPMLMISFTCKKCDTRSSHAMSKQAYTGGTVLIKCPGCSNRHLIADHLKIFSDERITVEDILSANGESVSQDTNDLVFEEIPDKLKGLIGHHAPDAPESHRKDKETDKDVSPQIEAPKKD